MKKKIIKAENMLCGHIVEEFEQSLKKKKLNGNHSSSDGNLKKKMKKSSTSSSSVSVSQLNSFKNELQDSMEKHDVVEV
jgi:hypothetical protein